MTFLFPVDITLGNFKIKHKALKTGTTPSLDRETKLRWNEACLETPLQYLLPATLRMKLLQLLQQLLQ